MQQATDRRRQADAMVLGAGEVAFHAATPQGAVEVDVLKAQAQRAGDTMMVAFMDMAQNMATGVHASHAAREAEIAARQSAQPVAESAEVSGWDPGTPSTEVGEHWSIAEGGTRWHEGGCGAFAIAMTERWPHLKIACEMYHDCGAESVAHAWAYDPATNTRFHIFGAEKWEPTTRPDYDPDSHRALLDQSPDDVRRLFRGFNTGEDHVFDAMDVACEMFDPDYEADAEFDRNHLYFW